VTLKPGESRTVKVRLEPRVLANFDTAAQKWKVAEGSYKIAIARSVNDAVLDVKLNLKAQTLAP
jgi:beta-glucosidase